MHGYSDVFFSVDLKIKVQICNEKVCSKVLVFKIHVHFSYLGNNHNYVAIYAAIYGLHFYYTVHGRDYKDHSLTPEVVLLNHEIIIM